MPAAPCSSIKWGTSWRCTDCPRTCTIAPSPAPPLPAPALHPFAAAGGGDVDGPFEFNGTYHLFRCCDWDHLTAPSPAGPWTDVGGSIVSTGRSFISGSVTIVDGLPRIVAPLNRGNNPTCCAGPPSNGTWAYPCVANPASPSCFQDYVMSRALNASDPLLRDWEAGEDEQATVVSWQDPRGVPGARDHGWVQQDPSRAWRDPRPEHRGRWLFLGGTSVNGSAAQPGGVPTIELFGSRNGSEWAPAGFEYLGVFSAAGLAMCDPELVPLTLEDPARPVILVVLSVAFGRAMRHRTREARRRA